MDLVIPIPDPGIVPALAVAESLGKPYRHAFSRNRYIFRTFIMSSQEKRRKGVQSKLSPLKSEFRGKNVLLIDDTYVGSSPFGENERLITWQNRERYDQSAGLQHGTRCRSTESIFRMHCSSSHVSHTQFDRVDTG